MGKTLPNLLLLLALSSNANSTELDPELQEALGGFDDSAMDRELEEALGGFEQPLIPQQTEEQTIAPIQPWSLSGDLILSTSYNFKHSSPRPGETDHQGFSRLRAKLNLEWQWDINQDWQVHIAGHGFRDFIYKLQNDSDYHESFQESMEHDLVLGEAWLRGRLHPKLDIKLGRQIVVWGKSDNLRVTDVLNPLDMREMGLVDIEDLRLPVTMAKLDYYWGDWNLSAMAIPEIRFNRNPAFGSDFYPFPTTLPPGKEIKNGGNNTEYALALNGIFSGWDLSLYAARLFDDQPHIEAGLRQHSRLTMFGASTNVAMGNWLLKGELAHLRNLEYSPLPGEKKNRSDLLLGIEYSGFTDATLSLEILDRHIHDYDHLLKAQGIELNEWQTALRYQNEFLHARLKLTALITLLGDPGKGGGFARLQLSYELADGLNLTGGLVAYDAGEKFPFNAIGDNDRLFLDLKYSF